MTRPEIQPGLRQALRAAPLATMAATGAILFGGSAAAACPPEIERAYADLKRACSHDLCGLAMRAPQFEVPATNAQCASSGWPDLLTAIDATIAKNGFVLLGEVHDNDHHHRLRAAILARTGTAAAPVVFEQLTAEQRPALAPFAETPKPGSPVRRIDEFLAAAAWDRSAWAKQADYTPLFEAVLSSGRALHAGDPGRAAMMRTAREGSSGVADEERRRFGLEASLGEDLDKASLAEIEEAHCGLMPAAARGGMAYAQRYRDGHLADAVISAAGPGGAVLIAGNGHVRSDRGVPWYLAHLAPGRPVLAVIFTETGDAGQSPPEYVPRGPGGTPATDWIVLTPGNPKRDPDPCAGLRAAFEKMKKSKPE